MAEQILESAGIWHNYEEYSVENVRAYLEKLRADGDSPEEIAKFQSLFEKYPDQFSALYRIKDRVWADDELDAGLA